MPPSGGRMILGSGTFTLTGTLKWWRDYPPQQYDGAVSLGIEMPSDSVLVGAERHPIDRHRIFVSAKYKKGEVGKRDLEAFLASLKDGAGIFATGDLKTRKGKDGAAERIDLQTRWSRIRIGEDFPIINRFVLEGQVAAKNEKMLLVRFGYRIPNDNTMGERSFPVFAPGAAVEIGSPCYSEGHVYGVKPDSKESCLWLYSKLVA